ncbi:hypothetical protein Btru_028013 [Bulinus truncatus]|nr:hypothetical protein Btru_028013 [Bulinus truncatus]
MEYRPAYIYTTADVPYNVYYPGNDPYAFVEFIDGSSAAAALAALNKRMVMGKSPVECWNMEKVSTHMV